MTPADRAIVPCTMTPADRAIVPCATTYPAPGPLPDGRGDMSIAGGERTAVLLARAND
jgi:hypothetical protein